MIEDAELLRRYAEEKSDAAFTELVERRVGFVYACALRRVGGNAHLAQDVTQRVFLALARHAAKLVRHEVLSGWLYVATRNAAAQVVRGERRRQAREQEAQIMHEINSDSGPASDWARLRPVLDDALDGLGDDDRQAVLLRFFEGKSFAEVGASLRLTENAARMRVQRALDKLQALLAGRGVTSTAAALSLALAEGATVAAPAGLATAVTGAVLGAKAVLGAGLFGGSALQLTLGSAVVVGAALAWVGEAKVNRDLRAEIVALRRENGEIAELQQKNRRLALAGAEVDAWREDQRELAGLREQLATRKQRLAERPAATEPVAVEAKPRVVRISGAVVTAAQQELPPDGIGLTLRELVAKAGLTGLAKRSEIRVTRPGANAKFIEKTADPRGTQITTDDMKFFSLDLSRDGDFVLQPNDYVYVPERTL